MKKTLLILLTLAGTVQMNALFRTTYEYDENGDLREHHGLIGSTVRGVVHAGEDVVDVVTSPVRGGYTEVRLERIDNRIDEIKRELRNRDLDSNKREALKSELSSLRREKRNKLDRKKEAKKESRDNRNSVEYRKTVETEENLY